ncbi:MAG: GNAT family N-acetyltransferase, partial [Planctomycetota bacterium]|nr:GNAT family N-acetyltransferase [Planctomycetota bacterium]
LSEHQSSGDDCGIAYPYLDSYWSEPGRHPFFIIDGGRRVGLVMIRGPESTGEGCYQIAEYFVEPQSRRSGVGTRAIASIWKDFPGEWTLQAFRANAPAISFWTACLKANGIRDVARSLVQDGGERVVRWEFTAKGTA